MNDQISQSDGNKQGTKSKKARIPGVISIDKERCKGCGFCVAFCPLGVLRMSAEFNAKGYHYPEVAHAEKCTGCGLCGMYCPDFAIHGARSSGIVRKCDNLDHATTE